jgi:hypothetical protein
MTFDISPFIKSSDATQINKFVVFQISDQIDPVRNSDVVLYFDDIKFSAKKLLILTTYPPVDNPLLPSKPMYESADVKSIFSEAYAVYKRREQLSMLGQSTIVSGSTIVTGNKHEN